MFFLMHWGSLRVGDDHMTVYDKSIDWGTACGRCPNGPDCTRVEPVIVCPVDGSLLLYRETVHEV